jgi:hypothetical protein
VSVLSGLIALTKLDLSLNQLVDFTLTEAAAESSCLSPLEARLREQLADSGTLIGMAALNTLQFPELEDEDSFASASFCTGTQTRSYFLEATFPRPNC